MASSNLDLVRSIYEDWERGDWHSAEWAHPEIEFAIVGGPEQGSWKGLAQMTDFWRRFLSAWEEYQVAAEELRELDEERILVFIRLSGRGKTSGIGLEEMEAKSVNLWQLQDGKVIRLVAYMSRQEARADLGLE